VFSIFQRGKVGVFKMSCPAGFFAFRQE